MERDAKAGLLTTAEFRAAMRKVYDHASTWPESRVSRASQAILRALTSTSMTADELAPLLTELIAACNET